MNAAFTASTQPDYQVSGLGTTPSPVTAGQFVKYYKDPAKATADLAAGAIQLAFFLNPVSVAEFREVSLDDIFPR